MDLKHFFLVLISSVAFTFLSWQGDQKVYKVVNGSAAFYSNAPLEQIRAKSDKLKGLLDLSSGSFAFKIEPASFQGFNGEMQREHFNENFMESVRFPSATFSGKLIDPIDPEISAAQIVRAKGKLTIHGVEKERIIRVNVQKVKEDLEISSEFIVPLKDHNITIPKVVHQKIAEDIEVTVKATLSQK